MLILNRSPFSKLFQLVEEKLPVKCCILPVNYGNSCTEEMRFQDPPHPGHPEWRPETTFHFLLVQVILEVESLRGIMSKIRDWCYNSLEDLAWHANVPELKP